MNQPLDRIVFDLDNTLIRTEIIKDILRTTAVGIYGYTSEEAEQWYQESRLKDGQAAFTIERYQNVLRKHLPDGRSFSQEDVERVQKQISDLGPRIVVPGAPEFVREAADRNMDQYLISLGEPVWQRQKLTWVGLDQYFPDDHAFYTFDPKFGKSEALKHLFGKKFGGEQTVLFNDKPDETADILRDFPALRSYVRFDEHDKRYRQENFESLLKEFPDRVIFSPDFHELADHFRETYWSEPTESRREFSRK